MGNVFHNASQMRLRRRHARERDLGWPRMWPSSQSWLESRPGRLLSYSYRYLDLLANNQSLLTSDCRNGLIASPALRIGILPYRTGVSDPRELRRGKPRLYDPEWIWLERRPGIPWV